MSSPLALAGTPAARHRARLVVIALTAFLTLVDLFATQAILPSLARHYGVTPAAMGLAVNASTLGMAIAGIVVALASRHIDAQRGTTVALALLAVPTAALAFAPDLTSFTWLRIAQGLAMSTAFTLTLSYLGEQCSPGEVASAFAAYVTGNVASNLFGRLMSATLADHLGLAANFWTFAALNLAGAVLAYYTLARHAPAAAMPAAVRSPLAAVAAHLRNPVLRTSFAIGFLILFAFIGTFTYVNFVLARAPIGLSMMSLGLVYFVFLPSMVTTPLAGRLVSVFGARGAFLTGIGAALAGLPLLLAGDLVSVIAGLALVGAGTFFAQATTTGVVGRAADSDRGVASGLYLASYFSGGLVGTFVLGELFDRFGWLATVAGIGVALVAAAWLGLLLTLPAGGARAADGAQAGASRSPRAREA